MHKFQPTQYYSPYVTALWMRSARLETMALAWTPAIGETPRKTPEDGKPDVAVVSPNVQSPIGRGS